MMDSADIHGSQRTRAFGDEVYCHGMLGNVPLR